MHALAAEPLVGDVGEFVDAPARVAAGGTALDPKVVTPILTASRRTDDLNTLTPGSTTSSR